MLSHVNTSMSHEINHGSADNSYLSYCNLAITTHAAVKYS